MLRGRNEKQVYCLKRAKIRTHRTLSLDPPPVLYLYDSDGTTLNHKSKGK